MSTTTQITEHSTVALHFAVALVDGTEVDSTFDDKPATFRYGDGNLLPGFESKLLGLKPGDKTTFRIESEEAFGAANPNNVQEFDVSEFEDSEVPLDIGLVIFFEDAKGSEIPGVITDINEGQVQIDFNHPLAGKDLDFTVDIVAVTAEETPVPQPHLANVEHSDKNED